MWLIVGLGNPGSKYSDTPHNAGFVVMDRFAERHYLGDFGEKFRGLLARGKVKGEDVGVLKPMTYMNLSGESVAEALRYLPVDVEGLVVVFDDMDLSAGRLRIRRGGGHGGHNGMRSLIQHLGSRDFARIRVGVGRPAPERDPTGHVLSKLRRGERERFSETVNLAVEALDSVLEYGVDEAMNRYNGLLAVGKE